MKLFKKSGLGLLGLVASAALATSAAHAGWKNYPIILDEQGSFNVGGNVIETPGEFVPSNFPAPPEGQTLHGDHAYVQYQIPFFAREYPLVMWHGGGQSGQSWETTADGREGYRSIFARRHFSTYIIDQAHRGRAGTSTEGATIVPVTLDQFYFNLYRIGEWPNYFDGVQFSQDPAVLEEYLRKTTVDTGPADPTLTRDVNNTSALFDQIGGAVLVTHSAAGGRGWMTRLANDNVKGIVNYEGVQYVFPEGEAPPPIMVPQIEVPMEEFLKLTEIPIKVVFGDNIPDAPAGPPGPGVNVPLSAWGSIMPVAQAFVDKINEHGGNATFIHLPEIGIYGNTHFPFSDTNNREIADLMHLFLYENGLAGWN